MCYFIELLSLSCNLCPSHLPLFCFLPPHHLLKEMDFLIWNHWHLFLCICIVEFPSIAELIHPSTLKAEGPLKSLKIWEWIVNLKIIFSDPALSTCTPPQLLPLSLSTIKKYLKMMTSLSLHNGFFQSVSKITSLFSTFLLNIISVDLATLDLLISLFVRFRWKDKSLQLSVWLVLLSMLDTICLVALATDYEKQNIPPHIPPPPKNK